MFFNVALLGKKINKICMQANYKQDVVNTLSIIIRIVVKTYRLTYSIDG